jgi:hypothetical protein
MDIPDGTDPYVVGELLKEYFRDLKKPLCTYKRYEHFDHVNGTYTTRQLDPFALFTWTQCRSPSSPSCRRSALGEAAPRAPRMHRRSA